MKNPHFNTQQLWSAFTYELKARVSSPILNKDILTKSERTSFHKNIIHEIFNELISSIIPDNGKLEIRDEYLQKVDHVLIFKEKNGYEIPIILIEVENNPDSESNIREFDKMCYLTAPLKVIFLNTNLERTITDILEEWTYLLKVYIDNTIIVGDIGLVVGDYNSNTPALYYSLIVSDSQNIIKTNENDWNRIELNLN